MPQLAKIPVRVGQARRLYSYRFTKRVVVRSEIGDTTSHWVDILLDYARALDCDTVDRSYRFAPTAADVEQAQRRVLDDLPPGAPFTILNPCNAVASHRDVWPVEGWAALARALRERFGMPVLISGAPADVPIVQRIAEGAGGDRGIVPIAGRLSIGEFGALAKRASSFVGITTGSMHVAAAVGCPTVGIFPFQSDYPDRWAPLGPHTAIVRPSYPCHRGDTKERCRDYACVAHLDVPAILNAAGALVTAS
jgi:ADP-heptose:LPS heptosyltransferase